MSQRSSSFEVSNESQHNIVTKPTVEVIERYHECRRAVQTLRSHCDEFNVLGFDCEWVPRKPRRPIALLQLASNRGFYALFRLCKLGNVPNELRELLEDGSIVKVGVEAKSDANYLLEDYDVNVKSTFDLRYMAETAECIPGGLAKMSENYLGWKLKKLKWIEYYKWELRNLTEQQIEYAANDAYAGIELFKFFAKKLQSKSTQMRKSYHLHAMIDEYCGQYFDTKYVDKNQKRKKDPNRTIRMMGAVDSSGNGAAGAFAGEVVYALILRTMHIVVFLIYLSKQLCVWLKRKVSNNILRE